MDLSKHPHIKNILDAWPIYAAIGSVLVVLVTVFFDDRVSSIAKAEIIANVPVSQDFLDLKADIATLQNDLGDAEGSLERFQVQMLRVEGKLDDLLLIMASQ